MTHSIAPYLQSVTDRDATELENALARVSYLESLIGQSDIESALLSDNAALADQVKELQKSLRHQKKCYQAQSLITEQVRDSKNELIERAQASEKCNQQLRSELARLGAHIAKKIK
ncbi:hypothetical protein KCG43_20200 [Photobacterium sp. WH24]|uniref:hypothetical protein n=1 Tax=Photobacterium sp. WH24 TaxID=2827237 RepID=UPI001C43FDAC|nr:hypothetical protein [Photobacterium sp. WH24]MBV7264337.1 hypothetical protein [Photobacterium sp. WH24]